MNKYQVSDLITENYIPVVHIQQYTCQRDTPSAGGDSPTRGLQSNLGGK